MCGIAGICGFVPDRAERVRRMSSLLRHRGPDEDGFWETEAVALGHTRLKVVDLSAAGRQPMHRGPHTVVYNGEIYNWRSLRAGLEREGMAFRSSCDTEVLLAMYERYGIGMLSRLEGMFAFALWDGERRLLHLVRDRYGVKPLLYAPLGGAVAFASELRCFRDLPPSAHRLDRPALAAYLATNYIPAPRTIWEGVRRLPPGSRLEVRPGRPVGEPIRWFDPVEAVERDRTEVRPLARERLREALAGAVDLRLQADVPVGIFLSGGVDSSIVAALAAARRDKVVTLTVGYADAPTLDEREPARRVAEWLGTEHREILLSAEDAHRAVGEVLDRLDEPFADDSLVPTYVLSRAARREVTVALSGDGGDELFGGYAKYLGSAWARVPGTSAALRGLAALTRPLPEGRTRTGPNLVRMLRRFARGADRDLLARHRNWVSARPLEEALSLAAVALPPGDPVREALAGELARTSGWDDELSRVLMADVGYVLPHDMLEKVDRASMWCSLEVRSPFLDRRLLPLAFSFPGSEHVGLVGTKRVLRSVFADLLPREVLRRPKRGFGIPLGDWMRGPLRRLVEDHLGRGRLEEVGLLEPDPVGRLVEEHLRGRRDRSWELWNLVVLQAWAAREPWSA